MTDAIHISLGSVIDLLPVPVLLVDPQDFRHDLLRRVAGAMGISYKQLAAEYRAPDLVLPAAALRLAASGDRRQVKRGVRRYCQLNGLHAANSYLTLRVNEFRAARVRERLNLCYRDIAEQWFCEQRTVDMPPGRPRGTHTNESPANR